MLVLSNYGEHRTMRVTYLNKTAQTTMPKWVVNFIATASKTFTGIPAKKDLFRSLLNSGIITKEIVIRVMNETGTANNAPAQPGPVVPSPGIAQQPAPGIAKQPAPASGVAQQPATSPAAPNMAV